MKITDNATIKKLIQKGVQIRNPAGVEIGAEVDPDNVSGNGVVIHTGCKIFGSSTVILQGARLGFEGPATVVDCQIGPQVELKGGFFQESVFLQKSKMGYGAHVRSGTILEEQASGAHTVGLKQTILFPFVTLGSLINFCDCLMSGGTSRKDHSEVGSSYIHFNFTPNQDKATASLIGDVPYYVLGPLVTDIASGHDHIASAIGAAVSASEGVDLLCYLTPSEHLALPNAEEVKAGLIAYRIAAHAGDLVKIRERAIKWDKEMTEARRTLDWEKQLALSIDPEEAAKIHSRTGQHPGNNVPCTMCGGACVYVMLPQQRKYEKENENLQQIE